MLRLVLAGLLLALVAGCGGTPPAIAALAGTSWTVERVVLSDDEVRRGDGESITFGADGAVSVSSCNQCSGRARAQDGGIVIDPAMGCTKRACGPGVLELERLVAGRTLRREGLFLIADGPASTAPDLVLPTVVLPQTPGASAP